MADAGGRVVGYVVAAVVGVGIGGFFGFSAFVSGLCANWGEQCSAEETAEMERLWRMALGAPVVTIGAYAVIDVVVSGALSGRGPGRRGVGGSGREMVGFARLGQRGPVDGTVVAWHDEAGWGVVVAPEVDGEVWVHHTNLANTVPRPLRVGLAVRVTFESPGPEGYAHQAIWVMP